MITQENQPKRGAKCYWKQSDDYRLCYFLNFNQMPVAPHAIKVERDGQEWTIRDFECFTEEGKLRDKHSAILARLLEGLNKMAQIARDLSVPYSRVLSVNKQAKALGIIHAKET